MARWLLGRKPVWWNSVEFPGNARRFLETRVYAYPFHQILPRLLPAGHTQSAS